MIFSYLLNMESHPSWVCGLKPEYCSNYYNIYQSHPSWVCGLKLFRADKLDYLRVVTPFVGVWIETYE